MIVRRAVVALKDFRRAPDEVAIARRTIISAPGALKMHVPDLKTEKMALKKLSHILMQEMRSTSQKTPANSSIALSNSFY